MMVKDIKEAHVMPDWNDCEHEWQEAEDSMATSETHTDVACKKCDCPGERTEATGEVFWPAKSTNTQIIQNELECTKCGDIIYSAHRHDFKYCKCGSVAVDGGMNYLRRVGNMKDTVDRSMYMDEDALADCKEAIRWAEDTDRNELGTVLAVIRALRQHGLLDMSKF